MIVQINTDHNIAGSDKLNDYLESVVNQSLDRYSKQLTRVEIHFTDENGSKEGLNDKRCVMEARIEGVQPVVVTSHADTVEQALNGAIVKLRSSLDTVLGKLNQH